MKISLQTNFRFREAYCETRPAKLTNHNIGNNSIQDLIIYKKAEKSLILILIYYSFLL